jgi:hypothetical protein
MKPNRKWVCRIGRKHSTIKPLLESVLKPALPLNFLLYEWQISLLFKLVLSVDFCYVSWKHSEMYVEQSDSDVFGHAIDDMYFKSNRFLIYWFRKSLIRFQFYKLCQRQQEFS